MLKKYILSSISIMLFIYIQILTLIGLSFIELLSVPYIVITCLITIISTIIILNLYFSKKAKYYNIGVIITIIFNIISLNSVYNLNKEYKYIENILNNEYKYVTYNLYVQKKNTSYNEIDKLSGKKIGLLTNKENINYHLNQKTNIECIKYKTIEELEEAINNGEIQSFILSESEKNLLEKYTNLKNKTRIIYTNKIIDTI